MDNVLHLCLFDPQGRKMLDAIHLERKWTQLLGKSPHYWQNMNSIKNYQGDLLPVTSFKTWAGYRPGGHPKGALSLYTHGCYEIHTQGMLQSITTQWQVVVLPWIISSPLKITALLAQGIPREPPVLICVYKWHKASNEIFLVCLVQGCIWFFEQSTEYVMNIMNFCKIKTWIYRNSWCS